MEWYSTTRTAVNVKIVVWTCIAVIVGLQGLNAQVLNRVIALENSDVQLTILIPNNELAITASYILIRHDAGNRQDTAEVVFLLKDGPKVKDVYSSRLTATHSEGKVSILLNNVSAADAGTYRCYFSGSSTAIPDCEQLLIIVRKPNPPTVTKLQSSTSLLGSTLYLVCEPHSASLPPNHGLSSSLFWYHQNGDYIDPTLTHRRIQVDRYNQLVIGSLRHEDANLKVYCTSSDNTGASVKQLISEPSQVFVVAPEYKPEQYNLILVPEYEADEIIRKAIGQQFSYRCEAACVPQCQTVWMYKPYGGAAGFGEVTLRDKRVLNLDVTRINEGYYRCQASNKHGTVYREFYLEAMYITNPIIHVNGQQAASIRLLEDSEVNLSCVFDSNPGPFVIWTSPSKAILSSEMSVGPQEKLASNGIHVRSYRSDYSLPHVTCEDSGLYRCEGRNNISSGEGQINVRIMCPPSNAGIPGLDLLPEYVWTIPETLMINFVIRALPVPDILRIVSTINGQSRMEVIPTDFAVSKSNNYDGKSYLTKFTLSSRRNLGEADTDRILSLTIESSEFTKDFSFMIRPTGPPRKVSALTATDTTHNSVTLSWIPDFNGGHPQTFRVELRPVSSAELQNENEFSGDEHVWTLVLENIPDSPDENFVTVRIRKPPLKSNTNYVVRVTAVNKLGITATEIRIKTADQPQESMGAGAIVGIVIVVVVILAVVCAAIYFIIYRRRCAKDEDDGDGDEAEDKENGEVRKSMIPKKIADLLQRNKNNNEQQKAVDEQQKAVDDAVQEDC